MKLKNLVVEYLKAQPLFRERVNKDRGIVNILMTRNSKLDEVVRNGTFSKGYVVELMREYASMDRYWRLALKDDPSLRGKDYDDKEVLEQETEIGLGYRPGHHADVKALGNL